MITIRCICGDVIARKSQVRWSLPELNIGEGSGVLYELFTHDVGEK